MATAGTPERILLVENDPDISDLIERRALRPLGYDVRLEIEAATGIRAARSEGFDLIIADLTLPDLEGTDLLAALAAQGNRVPVVVIVTKGAERHAIQALRMGAMDVLLWPANDVEIVRVVERALQPSKLQRRREVLNQEFEALHSQLRRATLELNTMLSLSRAVTSGTEQGLLFDRVLEVAAAAAEADMAWLTVRDSKSGDNLLRAERNLPGNWAAKIGRPLDDGLSGLVVNSGETLLIHGKPMEQFKISGLGKSAAVVPVKGSGDVLGVIVVVRKADVEMGAAVKPLLEGYAGIAAFSLLEQRVPVDRDEGESTPQPTGVIQATVLESMASLLERLRTVRAGEFGVLTALQRERLAEIEASLDQVAGLVARSVPPDRKRTG